MALAIQRMGATQAAAIGSLGPVLTMFASWALLHEPMSAFQAGGLALVMFGVSRLKPKAAQAPGAQPAPAVRLKSAAG
jgi:multidrug transporter EmrE-like cation transporter